MKAIKLTVKMVLAVSAITILGIGVITYLISSRVSSMAEKEAYNLAREPAYRYSQLLSSELEYALNQARALSDVLEILATKRDSGLLDRTLVNEVLKHFIESHESYIGVYACFEPNLLDGKDEQYKNTQGHDDTGRFIPHWTRDAEGEGIVEPLTYYEVVGFGNYYLIQIGRASCRERV